MIKDVIIVGGGPGGLMAANQLEGKKDYLLLEKNEKVGKKLLLTGGKRCNITNTLSIEAFIESLHVKHKRFLYKALQTFKNEDILQFFKQRGLNLISENDFKYFPETGKSRDVLNALLRDIKPNNILYNQSLKRISKEGSLFKLETKTDTFYTKNVILAVGSNAYPSTGSSGDIQDFAHMLGVNTIPFTPAEASLYIKDLDLIKDLPGLSMTTTLKINKDKKTHHGDILITHVGLSGPLILHISELVYHKLQVEPVFLSFPIIEGTFDDALEKGKKQKYNLSQLLDSIMTKRLSKHILSLSNLENKSCHDLNKQEIQTLKNLTESFTLEVLKVEDKEKAFVNAGGIDIKEMDPNTMQVKKVPGLYVIGESLDLQGPIGGFNITIAMSTGFLAAKHIKESEENR